MFSKCRVMTLCCSFCGLYWRSFVVIIAPVLFLPVTLLQPGDPAFKCLYVVLVMATYWVTEALPLGVTALIPILLLPLLSIMSTDQVCRTYFRDTVMMFMTSVVIAAAVEHVNLHKRIALNAMMVLGCSVSRMSLGLMLITMFISMWISNTAAVAMMAPIAMAVLKELEEVYIMGEFVRVYQDKDLADTNGTPLPSKITNLLLIGIAYSASIGGAATLIGTGTNLAFKGIYETNFPHADEIGFGAFMLYGLANALLIEISVWIMLNMMFAGMFRPNSATAQEVQFSNEAAASAKQVIHDRANSLGRMKPPEMIVAFLFVVVICLWFFRSPGFMPGWPQLFTDLKVGDATPACLIIIIMFILPSDWSWLRYCTLSDEERPTKCSPSIITWQVVHEQVPWGLCFLLGSGFVLAAAGKESGMSAMIGSKLTVVDVLPRFILMAVVCLASQVLTEFTSNVAISNIILPIIAEMAKHLKIHPLYLMLPAAISCSYAFMTPVGTPPNAYIAGYANIRVSNIALAGLGTSILSLLITVATFSTLGALIFRDLNSFPKWAE